MKSRKVILVAALVLTGGCQGQPSGDAKPDTVATLNLTNGNVVTFYDFKSKALVTEEGQPPTPSMTNKVHVPAGAEHLTELYTALLPFSKTPNAALPQSLQQLQDRLMLQSTSTPTGSVQSTRSALSSTAPETPPSKPTSVAGKVKTKPSNGVVADTLVGCNNGCCDATWLQNSLGCDFSFCNDDLCYWGWGEWIWTFFNYDWTGIDNDSSDSFRGMVCAASGTSTFTVRVGDGQGGTWSVPEAHYFIYTWEQNLWDEYTDSSVNSSSDPHLHTYCGDLESS